MDFMKIKEHQKINPTGTGLGLSICKMLVEKMRGNIFVKSREKVGTTFQVIVSSKAWIPPHLKNLTKEAIAEEAAKNMALFNDCNENHSMEIMKN